MEKATTPQNEATPVDVTLYDFPPSLCSQKVRLALAEKHVSYMNRFVDIEVRMQNYDPDYLRLNPRGVVPTLVVDGDRVVTDSARILRYVDKAFDGPSLSPSNEAERQAMDEWIDLQDGLDIRILTFGTMSGALGFFLRSVSLPNRKRKLLKLREQAVKENPDLVALCDNKLEDLQAWRSGSTNEEDIAKVRGEIESALNLVEARLAESPFLVGATYTLADLAWTVVLARLKYLGLESEFSGGPAGLRPHVADYYGRMRSRESFDDAGVCEQAPDGETRREMMQKMWSGASETRVEARKSAEGSGDHKISEPGTEDLEENVEIQESPARADSKSIPQ